MSLDSETLVDTPPKSSHSDASLSPTWPQPACANEKLTALSLDCLGTPCQQSDVSLSPTWAQPRSWTVPDMFADLAMAPPACAKEKLTTSDWDCQEDQWFYASKYRGSKGLFDSLRREITRLRKGIAELRHERKVAEIAVRDWQYQALGSFCAGDNRALLATLTSPPFQAFEAMQTAGGVANSSSTSTTKSSRHPADQGCSAECSEEWSEVSSRRQALSESCFSGRLPETLRDVRSPSPPPLPPPSPPSGPSRVHSRGSSPGGSLAHLFLREGRSPQGGSISPIPPMEDKGFRSRQWLAQQNAVQQSLEFSMQALVSAWREADAQEAVERKAGRKLTSRSSVHLPDLAKPQSTGSSNSQRRVSGHFVRSFTQALNQDLAM